MKHTLLILFIIPTYLFSQANSKKVFLDKNSPLSEKIITAIATDAFDNKWICTLNNIILSNTERVEFKNNITIENSLILKRLESKE